ncbi:helix-turn-helix transcriptional regulator [Piscinibacter sp.]|uniref:helix-turn-helix transcriptional regulator n=1 Tax=Piscinibacter sp. TaxID=1903157 RepID=UPI00355A7434
MVKYTFFGYNFEHMSALDSFTVLERQLLLQLGDRLRRLRKAQGVGTVEMAKRVGISRTTLSAVEAGDPGPSMGTYLRVMSVLGIGGELALLAGDTLQPATPGSAAARSRRGRPVVQVLVSADLARHQVQDLQSLALHEEAVRLARSDPALLLQAQETLERWLSSGNSRSMSLWQEWQDILRHGKWRKILGRTRRAQELRQASPLTAVLPDHVRRSVLDQVSKLKKGVVLGDGTAIGSTS